MLRRVFLMGAVTSLMLSSAPLFANTAPSFKVNDDYFVLEKPIPDAKNTLIKVWSYACPHCYKYERYIDPVIIPEALKKDHLRFESFHLSTKGTQSPLITALMAGLLVKDKMDGVEPTNGNALSHRAKLAWYDNYHNMGVHWDNDEAGLLDFTAVATGLTPKALKALAAKPEAKALMKRWEVGYDIAKKTGIPAYVVNGRYLINPKALQSLEGMSALIDYLAKEPQ